MTLKGKGFYIWKVMDCEGGDPGAIAEVAQQAGLTHVLIKVANGIYSSNYDYDRKLDLVPPVLRALRARGIQVWGWHYVYGNDPVGEARVAVQRTLELGTDGYVIDAEVEYKAAGRRTAAQRFMDYLNDRLSGTPIALSSYRYPSYHPQLPWKEFLGGSDLNMPQVYWMQATNAGAQLIRSVNEFRNMTPFRPVFPTGAAFPEHGWTPTSSQVLEFLQTAKSLSLDGVNFWSWDSCRKRLPEIWKLIAEFQWDAPMPLPDIAIRYIDALNSHDPAKVVALYAPNGVHITAARTIQGQHALTAWYQTLLTNLLPNARFTLTGNSGADNQRALTWTAASPAASVPDGRATLGLIDDKIAYHYAAFSVNN